MLDPHSGIPLSGLRAVHMMQHYSQWVRLFCDETPGKPGVRRGALLLHLRAGGGIR
jgi:hypothetical protein